MRQAKFETETFFTKGPLYPACIAELNMLFSNHPDQSALLVSLKTIPGYLITKMDFAPKDEIYVWSAAIWFKSNPGIVLVLFPVGEDSEGQPGSLTGRSITFHVIIWSKGSENIQYNGQEEAVGAKILQTFRAFRA